MKATMRQGGPPRQGRGPTKKPLSPARRASRWLIIINRSGLLSGSDSHSLVHHAILPGGTGQWIHHLCIIGSVRGNPRVHRRESGRHLWHRPMPGQRREVRRACRARLLPVTGFCAGLRVSPRRSRRNYRIGAEGRRPLPAWRVRRIRRHHLPAIMVGFLPHRRRGNDVTLPPEAAMGGGRA